MESVKETETDRQKEEWVELLLDAKKSGLTIEEIRTYLKRASGHQHKKYN